MAAVAVGCGAELDEEQAAMEKEFVWLLGQQLPLLLQQLSSLLTTSLRPILPKQQQQMQQGGQQQTVPTHQRQPSMGRGETSVNITSPGDRLTGSLSFEAESITRSELKIKLVKWNRGQQWKTTITPERPWKMGQLQDARNYLFMAVSLIESFSADPNKSESRESIHQFLERMAFLLKNAKDQLVRYDETRIFNESAANRMIFNPALPDDIMVRFYILNDRVFLQVYQVHFPSMGASSQLRSSIRERLSQPLPPPGRSFLLNNQTVEIIDTADVEVAMSSLKQVLGAVDAAYDQCYWFLEKIRLFP